MNIESKQILVVSTMEKTFTFNHLNDAHVTYDNPFTKVLSVELNECTPPQLITITGDDYDALGQWTDETLMTFIQSKYGLMTKVVIEETKEV